MPSGRTEQNDNIGQHNLQANPVMSGESKPKDEIIPEVLTPKQQRMIDRKGKKLYQLFFKIFGDTRTTLDQPLRFEIYPEDVPNHPEVAGTYGFVYPVILSDRVRGSYEHRNGYAGLYLLRPDNNVVYMSFHQGDSSSLAVIRHERYERSERIPIKQMNFEHYPHFTVNATTFIGEGYDRQRFQRMNETLEFAKKMIEAAGKTIATMPQTPGANGQKLIGK